MAAILSLQSWLDSTTTATVVAWLFRITLLSAVACAYLALARRAQPALRHAVAAGSLLAVALLPAAARFLPAVPIPVLRAQAVAPASPVVTDVAPITIDVVPAPEVIVNVPAQTVVIPATPPASRETPVSGTWSDVRDAFRSSTNWRRFALLLWVMVSTALLVRLGVAFARAHQISGRAARITDDAMRVEMERACRVLGVTRTIDVAMSKDVAIPMVVGVARPRVMLPAQAIEWSRERLGVVLLHEVAHIRRQDAVWMLFARVMSASLWFHPLVGLLSRHVRRESERACDDLVLASGVRGSDYAEHLVSIARMSGAHDRLAVSTLAFAARSTLEERVASVLAGGRRRSSPRVMGALVLASLVVFVAIAAAQPTERAAECAAECTTTDDAAVARTATFDEFAADHQRYQAEKSEYEQARQETQIQLAGNDDDEDDGEEWYDRAHNYYQRGRFDKAARAYENAARFGYNRATAYYNAGCSYALSNQSAPAIDALEAAFDEGFDDLDMYASDEDLNSLRDDPRFKKLMEMVMNSDEGDQRRRAAARDYDRLAARKGVDEGDWNSVGVDLLRVGDYDRAATAFDNELKLSKNEDEDALYNKACARALGGKPDEALKLLEQSIMTGSVGAEHMQEDADLRSLHKQKKFDELVDLARDLELNPDGESWSFDGTNLRKLSFSDEEKHWKKSLGHYQEVANNHPKIGRAWSNLGYAQLKSGDPKASTPSFQKALDLGYKPSTTMYNLACSTAQEGSADAAFAWLEKSEAAGFDVWQYARWDDDLDPLRSDSRWKALKQRWKDEERKHAEAHGVHIQID